MRLSAVRWAVVGLAGILATVGAFGAAAFACSNLATVILSTSQGRPGATVSLTGASFVYPRAGTGQTPTTVVIHWQTADGPTLAEAVPDRFGTISATFTVPQANPGMYVIFATQLTPRVPAGAAPDSPPVLVPEAGTPARSSFEILAPGEVGTVVRDPVSEPVEEATAGDYDSTVWLVLTAAFGAVALSLFGGGLIAFIHQSRESRKPADARWVPPGWYS